MTADHVVAHEPGHDCDDHSARAGGGVRAPDPTLTGCGLGLVLLEKRRDEPVFVAHRFDTSPEHIDRDVSVCGKPERRLRGFEPEAAAYLAVPCRTCFPDAPPPGWRHAPGTRPGVDGLAIAADPHLGWQLSVPTA